LKLFFRKPFNKIHFDISVLLSENDKIIAALRSVFVQLENDLGFLAKSFSRFQTIANTFTVSIRQMRDLKQKLTQNSRWKSVENY
jgi:hypothetical protein